MRTDNKKSQTIIQDLENTVTDLESDKKISTDDLGKLICDFESCKSTLENERMSNKKLSETLSSTTDDLKRVQIDYDQLKLQKLDSDNIVQNLTKDKCILNYFKVFSNFENATRFCQNSDITGFKVIFRLH